MPRKSFLVKVSAGLARFLKPIFAAPDRVRRRFIRQSVSGSHCHQRERLTALPVWGVIDAALNPGAEVHHREQSSSGAPLLPMMHPMSTILNSQTVPCR